MLDLTFTLSQIRSKSPCSEGWKILLSSLGYANGNFDPDRRVSLGDVAKSNDAADAIWCVRCLDWSDILVRRAVIAEAVLPAVKRASKHAKDKRVLAAIEAIEKWCAGDDCVDLKASASAAYAASALAAASSAAAYAYAAAYAASASAAAAAAAATTAARKAEREQQRADIISAFPPIN